MAALLTDVTLDDLIGVTPVPGAPDTFTGPSFDYGPLRVYGGHFIGQALAAAFGTIEGDRLCNSLHAYFLRVGDPVAPFHFTVQRLRDGGGYVNRYVTVQQNGTDAFALMASFKGAEEGSSHQSAMPAVPRPEAIASARAAQGGERFAFPYTVGTSVEVEVLDGWNPRVTDVSPAPIQIWLRAALRSKHDPRVQQCALAYLSDSTLLFNGMRPHGSVGTTHRVTSLDHALWFHRLPDCSEWLFYDQQGPAAADGRSMNFGQIYSGDGTLLASAAQEGMLRTLR